MSCKFQSVWGSDDKQPPEQSIKPEITEQELPENVVKLPDHAPQLYKIATLDAFEKFVQEEHGLIIFYADWCKICHHSSQDVLRLSKSSNLTDHKIKFALVDCTKKNEIMNKYKIIGVPMYFIVKNSEMIPIKLGTSIVKAFAQLLDTVEIS
jgi:thiol:disulfide interchange protein